MKITWLGQANLSPETDISKWRLQKMQPPFVFYSDIVNTSSNQESEANLKPRHL